MLSRVKRKARIRFTISKKETRTLVDSFFTYVIDDAEIRLQMENRSTVVYLADATDVMIMWFLKRFIVWALISGHDLFIAYCT